MSMGTSEQWTKNGLSRFSIPYAAASLGMPDHCLLKEHCMLAFRAWPHLNHGLRAGSYSPFKFDNIDPLAPIQVNMRIQAIIEVVDDNEDIRQMLSMVLDAHGFAVRTHCGGPEYLRADRSSGPRVMLLDIRMPKMSGIELLAKMREAGDDIPVVFMSGESLPHETMAAQESGAIAFMWKPFRTEQMLQAITQGLGTFQSV
ncbi:hypothetical protein B9Z51_05135 [Limnohabitans sp. T6-5]|uniref:response regulator transcription factor n=1 Tax=Limnohabitans sp. T6-5 TaxID=1100724 RepID=UPI000D3BC6B1|nr:response regulator [Limnohabitans sp. T6-5]PUE11660.1 hypothetical protein B9Z51_05135 [Limnohabitans sp. T6-5]